MPQTTEKASIGKRRATGEVDLNPHSNYKGKRRADQPTDSPALDTERTADGISLPTATTEIETFPIVSDISHLSPKEQEALSEEYSHEVTVDLNESQFDLNNEDDEPLSITELDIPGYTEDGEFEEPPLESIMDQLPEPLVVESTEFDAEGNPFDIKAPRSLHDVEETPLMATLSEMDPEELVALSHEEKLALAQQLSVEVAQTDYALPIHIDETEKKPSKRAAKREAQAAAKEAKRLAREEQKSAKASATPTKATRRNKKATVKDRTQKSTAIDPTAPATVEPTTGVDNVGLNVPLTATDLEAKGQVTKQAPATIGAEHATDKEQHGESTPVVSVEDVLEFVDFGPHVDDVTHEVGGAIDELQVSEHIELLRSQQNSKLATSAILAEVRERQIKEIGKSEEFSPHVEANEIPSRRKKRRNSLTVEEIAELRSKEEESIREEDFTKASDGDLNKYIYIAVGVMVLLMAFVVWNILLT